MGWAPAKRMRSLPRAHPAFQGVEMAPKNIRIETNLLRSLAFKQLSGSGKYIFLLFLTKRRWTKVSRSSKDWFCTNSDELVFTYEDAEKNHGYSSTKFNRAIEELVNKGFLDIAHYGGQAKGNYTKYSLSNRWERFGKEDFKKGERKKLYNGRGYTNKKFLADTNDSQKDVYCTQKQKADKRKTAVQKQ